MANTRILVTGAGGPAAISFYHSLSQDGQFEFFMADTNPMAQGLYLVPQANRVLVPPAENRSFVTSLLTHCQKHGIDLVVPTVSDELVPLALYQEQFENHNIKLLLSSSVSLLHTLDNWSLVQQCKESVPVPHTQIFNEGFSMPATWSYPVVIKPRRKGCPGITSVAHDEKELATIARGDGRLVQEHLPGQEYSVDVIADQHGNVLAAVPREHLKVDSGVVVASRTTHDATLIEGAINVVKTMGLTYISNVQFRRDAHGVPRILGVTPRVPDAISLTVKSGVHMPRLAVQDALGLVREPVDIGEFDQVAVVRELRDKFVEVEELEAMAASQQGS